MGYTANKFFAFPSTEAPEEYVFIDTSKVTSFKRIGKSGFTCVSFGVNPPKGLEYNYPIVLDDFTITSYPFTSFSPLVEVEYASVPANLKRRYTKWAKYQ